MLLSLLLSLVISFRLGDMIARPNPFNNYEIIWPGGTLDDVAEYAHRTPKGHIACYSNTPMVNTYADVLWLDVSTTEIHYEPAQFITCTDDFEQGTFRSIKITIADDQIR